MAAGSLQTPVKAHGQGSNRGNSPPGEEALSLADRGRRQHSHPSTVLATDCEAVGIRKTLFLNRSLPRVSEVSAVTSMLIGK